MRPLETESNIEVIRQMALWMRTQIEDLAKENQKLKNLGETEKQQWINQSLRDQLTKLQEKFYGQGRETLEPSQRPVGHLGEQLNLHGERESTDGEEVQKRELPISNTIYNYEMSKRELATESLIRAVNGGAEAWQKVEGLYQTSTEITMIERVYEQVIHRQQKYRLLKAYNRFDKEILITAKGPAKVRAGSKYSIDFAVGVAVDKYETHMPLERQRRKMASLGLDIEVKTLYGLCEAVAEHCNAVIPMIRKEITNDFCAVHLDESPWKILGAEGTSYMWAMSNRIGSYYQFEPSRSGKVAEEILADYEGSVVTDGYGGYNGIKRNQKIRLQQCWAHARREFFDLRSAYPKEVGEIVPIIDELFAIDKKAKTFLELRRLRKTESAQVIARIQEWLLNERPKQFPQSGLSKAINYSLKFWSELTWFLKDCSVPLSNNDAERALRHVVMGRKNFAGSKTINGADTAASLYTVIESAKKAGLNPADYLKYLIDARWFKDELKTPQMLAKEKFKGKSRVEFPPADDWKIN